MKNNNEEIEKCEICNRIISGMRGHPLHKKSRLCSLCYDNFRKSNLVWFKEKLNKEFEKGKASKEKEMLDKFEKMVETLKYNLKTLDLTEHSFDDIVDTSTKELKQKLKGDKLLKEQFCQKCFREERNCICIKGDEK